MYRRAAMQNFNSMTISPAVTFNLQPALHGTLIEVRPLRPDDFDALFAAASDPLIWEQHPEKDRYERNVFRQFFDGAIESGGAFAVIERGTGRIIGSSRYWNLKQEESEVEIGWTFLERAFWGGRYNGELKSLMIEHAFQFVDRVVFVIGEDNVRSQQAVRKIGAEFVSAIERPAPDGSMRRNVIFAMTRVRLASTEAAIQHLRNATKED
jgi:RimJ/RimL family protein N-acetyltransferase